MTPSQLELTSRSSGLSESRSRLKAAPTTVTLDSEEDIDSGSSSFLRDSKPSHVGCAPAQGGVSGTRPHGNHDPTNLTKGVINRLSALQKSTLRISS
jgi:hypothetical protein